jgi:hypothetical protein
MRDISLYEREETVAAPLFILDLDAVDQFAEVGCIYSQVGSEVFLSDHIE